MSSCLYICFEGLDGTGKTTLSKKIVDSLREMGYNVDIASPTKVATDSMFEKVFSTAKAIWKKSDLVQFLLYANRSNNMSRHVNWDSDIVIGDRSIVTSYMCRWSSSNLFNKLLVKAVNLFEYKINTPSYIIYLEAPIDIVCDRIKKRNEAGETPGYHEEKKDLIRMKQSYDLIRQGHVEIDRISHIIWHSIDASRMEEIVFNDTLNLILGIIKQKRIKNIQKLKEENNGYETYIRRKKKY